MENGWICFHGILGKAKEADSKAFCIVDTRNPSGSLHRKGPLASNGYRARPFQTFVFVDGSGLAFCFVYLGAGPRTRVLLLQSDRALRIISPLLFLLSSDQVLFYLGSPILGGSEMGLVDTIYGGRGMVAWPRLA